MTTTVPDKIRIRHMEARDLDDVVMIHMTSFPGFFLSFLGPRFLREFYSAFLTDTTGMAFIAESSSTARILGVVVGPLKPQGFFKRLLLRRWPAFCLAAAGAVARRPAIAPRLLRAVLYRGAAPDGPPRSLLSSIAVTPESQGSGIGRALVNRWAEEARKRGSSACFLTTDAERNDGVNRFYQKLGWRIQDTFTTQDRRMNRYVLDL